MKQGDIYLLNCDLKPKKDYRNCRPVLIVQSNDKIEISGYVTVIPFSINHDKKNDPSVVLIRPDKFNKLVKTSFLKLHQISSFKKERFVYKIGKFKQSYISWIHNLTYLLASGISCSILFAARLVLS